MSHSCGILVFLGFGAYLLRTLSFLLTSLWIYGCNRSVWLTQWLLLAISRVVFATEEFVLSSIARCRSCPAGRAAWPPPQSQTDTRRWRGGGRTVTEPAGWSRQSRLKYKKTLVHGFPCEYRTERTLLMGTRQVQYCTLY